MLLLCYHGGMDRVIMAIKDIQDTSRLRDQEVADALGVHVSQWRRVKAGKRYGRKFLDGAKAAYPHLFLPTNAINNSATR